MKATSAAAINSIIEDTLTRELRALCVTCIHRDGCHYYRRSTKAVIQCELFEEEHLPDVDGRGLCASCDNAPTCTLPGRKHGVWRCDQFR